MTKTEAKTQAPDQQIEAGLKKLEDTAAGVAPPAGTGEPGGGGDTAAGAAPPGGTPQLEPVPPGKDTTAGAAPPGETKAKMPPPPMFNPERPWESIVEGGFKTVAKNLPNVEWPDDGKGLLIWSCEAQLTKMMPRGIEDIEKYPVLAMVIAAVMIVSHNTELVEEADGTVHYSFWRFKPVPKKLPGKKTEGAQLKVDGEGGVLTKT